MSYLMERDDFFYDGLADLVELCEESDRIATIINKAECAARGHSISWTSSGTFDEEPPPGDYDCTECGETVTIREKQ